MGNRNGTEHWGTKIGVILAVAGSAVGLGNFLRFPGQAVAHGGGAFMIPYFCALLFLGLPVGWAEWSMARYGGRRGAHSAPSVLGLIGRHPAARYAGALGLLVPLLVYVYYILIESWCLRYALMYAGGGVELRGGTEEQVRRSAEIFTQVSGSGADGAIFGTLLSPGLACWLAVVLINLWILKRGLSGGIEFFCKWAMPAMAICAVIVLARVLTLGAPDPSHPEREVLSGLGFMWNPDFSKLADFETWVAAAGQIFFSLSVGFGVIINYASYLRRNDDLVLSSLTASATNELFEVVFGGLITVTAAFVFLGIEGATGGTFGLGFNTMPVVFLHMGGMGRAIGAIWFFMLFLAAITSSLSMLQPVKAFVEESLRMPPERAAYLVALFTAIGSLGVAWFSSGLLVLDTLDFWVGTFAILILALVQTILFGWVLGVKRGLAEAQEGSRMRIPRAFGFVIKYVSPVYLLVIIVGFGVQALPGYVSSLVHHKAAGVTVLLILAVTGGLMALIRLSGRPDPEPPDGSVEAGAGAGVEAGA